MNAKRPYFAAALLLVAAALAQPAVAQQGTRAIEAADVAAWKGIRTTVLSRDGAYFAYTLVPGEGDAEVVVRATKGETEKRYPIGEARGFAGGAVAFSEDGKWLAFATGPLRKDAEKLRKDKKPVENAAVLIELATGKRVDFPRVRSFAFDGKRAGTLALQMYGETAAPGATAKSIGADLVLYDLATSTPLSIGNVAEYAFDRSGRYLAWTVDARDQMGNGLRLRDLTTGSERALDGDRAFYRGLAWADSSNDRIAVLKGRAETATSDTLYQLLGYSGLARTTAPTTFAFNPSNDASFPQGMTIGASRTPRWSADRAAVFFGIRPVRPPADVASGDAADKPNLVLWHWKEPRLQSQQQVEKARDEAFTYLAAYRPTEKKFVRIADDATPDVAVAPKDRWALAMDEREFATENSVHGRETVDVYAIDLATGARKRMLERYLAVNGFSRTQYYSLSPDGVHFLSWSGGAYSVHDMATGQAKPLVPDNSVSFVDVEDDHPRDQPPIMPVSWSADGGTVLLTDRWDIWAVPLDGTKPVNLTVNGKKDGIRYSGILSSLAATSATAGRNVVDLTKPWYLTARSEWTKDAGIVRVDGRAPGATRLVWGEAAYGRAIKAADANVVVYTRETPVDFPNYYVSDLSFANGRKITDANPQQSQFAWTSGTQVVDYIGPKGEKLQASMLLPANFEKGRKYPTIVHIYEHRSQNRNQYEAPSLSALNGSMYASRGYVVVSPDINYKVDEPGTSAVKSVTAAAEAAIASGVVDKEKLGLTGHSWGGYQTAFIVTQTPLFKAAIAGAAPTDMISFYGDIYWNTGRMIAPIFESDQARFAKPYWEDMTAYVRESPVFHAKNVTTPLVLLANDKDGAVDWHQGIEYYNVLRRLSKPVVMLQYVGENHGLAVPANQKDYQRRMREFFDYYLKGTPAPSWWTEGVPLRKMDEHLKKAITAPVSF